MKLAFWLVVDLVVGILMLVFGDPKAQFAGLAVIAITLVVVVVLVAIGAIAGLGWGLESLFPHSGRRFEALAADLFMLGVLSFALANLGIGSWNPILVSYVVVQLPLAVFGVTAGQLLAGVDVVHTRSEPRGLARTLVEEAVLQLSVIQAALVVAIWLLRRLASFEQWWREISTRDRVASQNQSTARGIAAILALVLVGLGACSTSIVPATIADSTNYDRARACVGGEPTHPPTCLVEVPTTVLDIHDEITRDKNGNVIDSLYYVQVSLNGHPQSLLADTTRGTEVLDRLQDGESVTAGLWDGELVLVRAEEGDVWADGRRPGEDPGTAFLWLGLAVGLAGLLLGAAVRFWGRQRSFA